MKRVVLVHGWAGRPEGGWFPWLKAELEKRGFTVLAPELPETEDPQIENWVPTLAAAVGEIDSDTYFIGHSMGCQTIARFLANQEAGEAAGVLFVAGFFDSLTLDDDEDEAVWEKWRTAPLDLARVKARAPRSIAMFSDDDEYVPLSNAERFKNELASEIMIERDKGHWSFSDATEVPEILEAFLKLAQSR